MKYENWTYLVLTENEVSHTGNIEKATKIQDQVTCWLYIDHFNENYSEQYRLFQPEIARHPTDNKLFVLLLVPKTNGFDIVKIISSLLPGYIQYQGVTFEFNLGVTNKTENYFNMCYIIHSIAESSPHYVRFEKYSCWYNEFYDATQGFLYLCEMIENHQELYAAVHDCYNFLKRNNLLQ